MTSRVLLCVLFFAYVLTGAVSTKADTIGTFDVNATYGPGEVLDATLIIDLSDNSVLSVQGTFVDPRYVPGGTLTVSGQDCQYPGVGCVSWGAGTSNYGFTAPLVLSCTDFTPAYDGGTIPLTCQIGFLTIFGPFQQGGEREIGGAGLSGGTVTPTPEPFSSILLGTGLLGLSVFRRFPFNVIPRVQKGCPRACA